MSTITERRQRIERQRELRDRFYLRAMRAARNQKWNLHEYYKQQALIHCQTIKWLLAEEDADIPAVRFKQIY